MSIATRIMKLEVRGGSGQIPIWCDDDADVPATIDAMIAEGELQKADRQRCIHWSQMRAPEGCHERALEILT
jgi:hypothetical protein